ncbi:hypothetical protein BOX15_Mlig005134g2 [Macrostomum lignano]|uniref:Uncharacterized protein n=2 Tax=Macrostomum lignano TaxID=282301 RepID=A0A267FMU1_9PLAT|nr:hypothetical protein BOX15_Mlig005134g2 [Macrostomum lignano]
MADSTTSASDVRLELQQQRHNKQPKRLVYFSDGVLEEYSSSDNDELVGPDDARRPMHTRRGGKNSADSQRIIDPHSLTWLPWFWYYSCRLGRGLLRSADYCGERVAWFLGITTPKYGYIIREFHRIKEEEEKERLEQEAELEARQRYEAEQQQQQQQQRQKTVTASASDS